MILGLNANFAHNEYGLDMIYYSNLFIGIIFLIESVIYFRISYNQSKKKAYYLLYEHWWIAFLFIGFFFKHMHWFGAGGWIALGTLLLMIQYLIYGFYYFKKEYKKGIFLSLMVLLLILGSISSFSGFTWKWMHWAGAHEMGILALAIPVTFLIIGAIKRKCPYMDQTVLIHQQITKLPGKLVLVFCYFTIWTIHFKLVDLGIAPEMYSLEHPPAYEELRNTDKVAAEKYWENYEKFIENRERAGSRDIIIKGNIEIEE